jgi:hypothetical protein
MTKEEIVKAIWHQFPDITSVRPKNGVFYSPRVRLG